MKLSTFFPFRYGILLKLFTVVLIVLIPIYIIVSLMSNSGVDIIRQQILMLMEQKSDYFVSATDSELERIAKLQKDLADDPDLQSISIRPDTLRITNGRKRLTICSRNYVRFQNRAGTLRKLS